MQLHRALFPWEIALLPRETVFNSVTDVSQGKFPVLNKQVYFTLIELICWAILIWEQYLQKKFVLFLACNQTDNYHCWIIKANTNIPVEISAKLYVNFQHNMKYCNHWRRSQISNLYFNTVKIHQGFCYIWSLNYITIFNNKCISKESLKNTTENYTKLYLFSMNAVYLTYLTKMKV